MTTILINGVIQSGCNKNLHKRMEDYYEGSGSISNIKLGWHDIG